MSEATDGQNGSGSSTAPVYLRLQKRAQVESRREGHTPEQARLRSISLGFLVLVCLSCATWLLVTYVQASPRFHLRTVEVSGGKFVTTAAVEKIFSADRDLGLYQIPLEERRLEVEQIPWVRSATINRVLPDRVVVSVEEREPVAFLWTRHGIQLIDGDGMILETPANATWTFPVVRGVPEREKSDKRKERMAHYLELASGLRDQDGKLPQEISEVDLTDPADLCAVVTDASGAVQLHLGEEKFLERYAIYRSHIAEWRQQFNEIHSIDLRYEGQAVIQSGTPLTVSVDDKAKSSPRPATQSAISQKDQTAPGAPSPRTAL
jgi:cell division protein FtsQ